MIKNQQPVPKTLQTLLATTAQNDWHLRSRDIKTALTIHVNDFLCISDSDFIESLI